MPRRYYLLIFLLFITCGNCFWMHGHEITSLANQVLNEVPYCPTVCTIKKNEWRELKIDDLLHTFNYTKTAFGTWGLTLLTLPISDVAEIQNRQKILLQLIENDHVSSNIRVLLQQIAQSGPALLAYWDEHDVLHGQAKSLYFSIPFIKKYANNNRLLLESSMFFESSRSLLNVAKALCLGGLWQELMEIAFGGKDDFNIWQGLTRGFEEPFKNNNPFPDLTNTPYGTDFKTFFRIFHKGTLGDRCHIFTYGYDRVITIFLPLVKPLKFSIESVPKNVSSSVKWGVATFGVSVALGYTLWYDWWLYRQVQDTYKQLIFLHTTSNELQRRLVNIADFMRTTDQLYHSIKNDAVLKNSRVATTMGDILESKKISKTLDFLFTLLQAPTFKKSAPLFYSRGCVLFVHKKLQQVKQELVPLLQAIAELDAYYSIATVFKKYESTNTPFTFVTFVDREMPLLDLNSCWLPLLPDNQVVTNEVSFGIDKEHPTKLIITGPNGCGKSTYLKMLGQIAVLAQSWGIVPAKNARMTLLHDVRSCLASHEDIAHGLSTFMAEDERMEEIKNFIDTCPADKKCMVLIDEPWRGTVDAASAQYIYQFGQHIAPIDNCIACIATHVQKPVELADETDGTFANAHVAIDENEQGFVRTFTLQPGPALWWFNDITRRTRFIDWLKTIYGAQLIKDH
ncbi:MAG: hypothetical protein Q8Q25_02150 [bacterium]|nr:hypothetical protein [bacterium]